MTATRVRALADRGAPRGLIDVFATSRRWSAPARPAASVLLHRTGYDGRGRRPVRAIPRIAP